VGKYDIEFIEADAPITDLVTKFGGQPVWLERPEWPLPCFIQADEFPEAGPWRLLLQLDSMTVPFHVNFGDAGIGYAYISEDGPSGTFLWQCY